MDAWHWCAEVALENYGKLLALVDTAVPKIWEEKKSQSLKLSGLWLNSELTVARNKGTVENEAFAVLLSCSFMHTSKHGLLGS